MSGDNYLLSADYPGYAARLLEQQLGGVAVFRQWGAGQRRHRWTARSRLGRRRAHRQRTGPAQQSPQPAGAAAQVAPAVALRQSAHYALPARQITPASGPGRRRCCSARAARSRRMPTASATTTWPCSIGSCVWPGQGRSRSSRPAWPWATAPCSTFPGELYSEIGLAIKQRSPFRQTLITRPGQRLCRLHPHRQGHQRRRLC